MKIIRKLINNDDSHDLEYFNQLNYNIFLSKKYNKFILKINELNLVVSNVDLNVAYDKLENSKSDYFNNMFSLDCQDDIRMPKNYDLINSIFLDFLSFSIKTIIVTVTISLMIMISSSLLINKIGYIEDRIIDKLSKISEKIIK